MTVTELLRDGLLPAIVVLGATFAQSLKEEEKQDQQSPSASPGSREALRTQRQLRPLTPAEEGCGVRHLPAGVFGFTYAPGMETPLFSRASYRSFEVHTQSGGVVEIIGYVKPEEANRIRTGKEFVHARLYPEPFGDASTLVAVNTARLIRPKAPLREDGNPIMIDVSEL